MTEKTSVLLVEDDDDLRASLETFLEIAGLEVVGASDVFVPDGGAHRRFSTLWFRTYRYIEMTIQTAAEPMMRLRS